MTRVPRAVAFLLTRSFKNALLKRLRRLRQPRYLVSTLAGLAYIFFVTGGVALGRGSAHPRPASDPEESGAFGALIEAGLLGFMLLQVAWTWAFPSTNALAFTPAEVQFLFPAPLTRGALIRTKLLAAQPAFFMAGLVFAFVTRSASWARWWCVWGGAALVFNAAYLHRVGAALAVVAKGAPVRFRLPVLLGRLVVAAAIAALVASFQPLDLEGPAKIAESLGAWGSRAPASWALLPLVSLVRPAFAHDAATFFRALPGALAVLLGLYVWVEKADAVFEDAAVAASERLAKRIETYKRTGRLGAREGKMAPAPLPLGPRGGPLPALVWKNLLALGRTPLWRLALLGTTLLVVAFVATRVQHESAKTACGIGAIVAVYGAGMLTLFGPDFLRNDLRTSLLQADLLKTFPLRGWAVFLGEVLAPAIVIALSQTYLFAVGAILVGGTPEVSFSPELRFHGWLAASIAAGPVALLLVVLSNGAAVCFPGWIPLGAARQKAGGETFGINIVIMIARLVLISTALVPAGLVGFVVAALGWGGLGIGPAVLPFAAFLGALVVGGEVALLVWVFGRMLERFDPSTDLK